MSAAVLLDETQAKGVRLSARGDRLVVDAPKGVLTPRLLETLKRHKPDLLALLSGADPQQAAEAVRAHLEERAAIMEYDGGLPRKEAEHQAKTACRVYEYRLADNPAAWLVMIAPGCDLAEAERELRGRFADRLIDVREHFFKFPLLNKRG